jgi:hypothetical protein
MSPSRSIPGQTAPPAAFDTCTIKRRFVLGAARRTRQIRRAGHDGQPEHGPASPWRAPPRSCPRRVGTMALQPDIGAGNLAIMTLPSGMMTLSAPNEPSLSGSSGPVRAFLDKDGTMKSLHPEPCHEALRTQAPLEHLETHSGRNCAVF